MDDKSGRMVADDGNIIAPDCFWPICYTNPNIGQCDNSCWRQYRLMCARIVTHKAFEGFIIVLILVSSGVLCFEGYKLHEQPELKAALSYLNIVFTVFFFIEMVLKLFAFGFKKYFTTFWSILDFVIVLISIIDVIGTYMEFGSDISMVRVLRTLRALRPLRAVSRWESMTIIVNALIFAMPAIGNVLLVCIVFWLIFVIMGVQLFRGKFHYCRIGETRVPVYNTGYDCTNTTIPANLTGYRFPSDLTLCNNSIMTPRFGDNSQQWHWAHLCMLMGGDWYRPKIHFDHVGHGYLALYQTATFEGWMEVMEGATDSPPYLGEQAFREASLYTYIYFILFIIFGAYFTLNLFIGVIIENFNVLKKQYDGSYLAMFLTTNQRNYYTTLKKLSNKKPQKTIRRPKNKIHAFFFDVAVNTKFEITITSVIFFNMVAMMLEYEPEQIEGTINRFGEFVPKSEPTINYVLLFQTLEYINITFTVIFALEAAIKIIGLRLHYFRRAWNVFDFVVVFLSIIGILLDNIVGNAFISPTLLRVVRVFRIGRVLRLVKAAKGIRKLLFALIISIPALFNIACLLFLFMFMFAIVGMALFMHVGHQGALTSTVNFETFGRSMVLLFRLCTSGGWNDVIDPLMEDTNCNSTHYIDSLGIPQERNGGDCGNKTYAVIFFLLYLFISFMIIINMYIAVILENFSQAHEQEEIGITEDDMDMFYIVWEKYDPHATQYIKLEELNAFIDDLEAPLGIPKPNGMAIVAFNLPIVEGDRIHCLDVLMALVKRVLHTAEADESKSMTNEHQEANEKLKSQMADKYKSAFPQRQHVRVVTTTMQRKKEDVAAKTLQRAWRKHKMKQNIMRIKELALESSHNRDSLSHRLSDALVNIRSRIGSALSRISGPAPRRGSALSQYSIESATKTPRNTSRPSTPISKRLQP